MYLTHVFAIDKQAIAIDLDTMGLKRHLIIFYLDRGTQLFRADRDGERNRRPPRLADFSILREFQPARVPAALLGHPQGQAAKCGASRSRAACRCWRALLSQEETKSTLRN